MLLYVFKHCRLVFPFALFSALLFFLLSSPVFGANKTEQTNFQPLELNWQPGTNYIYNIKLSDVANSNFFKLGKDKLQDIGAGNSLKLTTDMIMHCYSQAEDGTYHFGVRFSNITDLDLQLQGESLLDESSAEKLLSKSRELLVDFDKSGKVIKIRHFLEQDPLLTRLIAVVVGEFQLAIPEDKYAQSWHAQERDYIGQGDVQYTLLKHIDEQAVIKKIKDKYEEIYTVPEAIYTIETLSKYNIKFSHQGYISQLDGKKTFVAKKRDIESISINTQIQVKLIKTALDKSLKFDSNSTFVDYDYRNVRQTEQAKLNALKQSAANLSPVTFFSWTDQFDQRGNENGREIFMMKSRMASQLELHPDLIYPFENKILSDQYNSNTKDMLLSILVNTGTQQAQNSLLRILGNDEFQKSDDFYSLLQTVTFLQEPVIPELMDLYINLVEKSQDQHVRFAAMYTTGSLIDNLNKHRNTALAHQYNKRFTEQLTRDISPENQYAMMLAIRNTEMPENIDIIRPFLQSESEVVRRGGVRALGKFHNSESTLLLLESLSDKSTNVKNGIIQSLSEHELVRSDMVVIKERVLSGDLDQRMDVTLIGLLMRYAKKYPQLITETLEAILARGLGNRETEVRVKRLIRSISRLRDFN